MRRTATMLMLARARGLARPVLGRGTRRGLGALRGASLTTFPLSDGGGLNVEVGYGGKADEYGGDLIVLPFWADEGADGLALVASGSSAHAWDLLLGGRVGELARESEFAAKSGDACVMTVSGKYNSVRKVALFGLGKREHETTAYAKLGAFAAEVAADERCSSVGVAAPSRSRDAWNDAAFVEALATGAIEGAYADNRFRTGANVDTKARTLAKLLLVDEPPDADDAAPDDAYAPSLERGPEKIIEAALGRARSLGAGVAFGKDLVNAPANVLTPKTLAIAAVELAAKFETLDCKCMGPVECEALGMGAYLGVAKGAAEENGAQFVHLTYRRGVPKTRLCVIGKGLTYDSGGYNLKPSAGGSIELMKFDMGGAAAALGCARAVAGLAVADCEVHFVVAACENMVSADAMRPGDVLTASNGKTIEVANTDAEGRLTLADALVYAEKLEVDAIVDLATLTGACVVALGDDVAGLFSTDDQLARELEAAASTAREQVWRMPLPPAYEEDIKSKIADLKNVGSRAGGAITAALFLGHFVEKTPHAHVDIAGPVWNGKAGAATGFGVKTMAAWVEARAADAPAGSGWETF